jgi:hypothetical protein
LDFFLFLFLFDRVHNAVERGKPADIRSAASQHGETGLWGWAGIPLSPDSVLPRLRNPTTEEPTESSRVRAIGNGGTLAIISSFKKKYQCWL